MIYETYSPEETFMLAEEIGKKAKSGEVYCLLGELGAGKTLFSQGFAKGLGINEYITSPTFTIVNEYDGKLKLNHFDMYRIEDLYELEEIGFDEYLHCGGVCLIEWANLVEEVIPETATWIEIKKAFKEEIEYRVIEIK